MRYVYKHRPPFPGTSVLISGTQHNGKEGVAIEKPWRSPAIAVSIPPSTAILALYSHNLIELLGEVRT